MRWTIALSITFFAAMIAVFANGLIQAAGGKKTNDSRSRNEQHTHE